MLTYTHAHKCTHTHTHTHTQTRYTAEYQSPAANPQDEMDGNPEEEHPNERILPSTDEFPTEEPVLRTLPELPAGLPSEVHKLIAR